MIRIHPDGSLRIAARVALAAAMLLAFFLLWVRMTWISGVLPSSFVASTYSRIGAVPVSAAGLAVYGFLFLSSFDRFSRGGGRLFCFAERVCCFLVFASAGWFVALQVGVLREVCGFCVVAHVVASIGATCLLTLRRLEGSLDARDFALSTSVAAVSFCVVLIAQRVDRGDGLPPVGEIVGPISPLQVIPVSLFDGEAEIDIAELPVMGNREAANKIFAMVDMTRDASRNLDPVLGGIRNSFGDELAVVVAPCGDGAESIAIHTTLLAVWHHDRAAYEILRGEIAAGLFGSSRSEVEARASELVGGDELRDSYARHADEIGRAIRFGKNVLRNARRSGQGALPLLLVGNDVIYGGGFEPRYFVEAISDELAIDPVLPAAAFDGPALDLVDGDRVKLGDVSPGSTQQVDVLVRNAGDGDLQIKWLKLPEGCAVVRIPRGAIPPGESGAIALNFSAPTTPGAVERKMTIHHNGSGGRSGLTLLARVSNNDNTRTPGDDIAATGAAGSRTEGRN